MYFQNGIIKRDKTVCRSVTPALWILGKNYMKNTNFKCIILGIVVYSYTVVGVTLSLLTYLLNVRVEKLYFLSMYNLFQ